MQYWDKLVTLTLAEGDRLRDPLKKLRKKKKKKELVGPTLQCHPLQPCERRQNDHSYSLVCSECLLRTQYFRALKSFGLILVLPIIPMHVPKQVSARCRFHHGKEKEEKEWRKEPEGACLGHRGSDSRLHKLSPPLLQSPRSDEVFCRTLWIHSMYRVVHIVHT